MQYKCRPFFVFMGKTEEFCCPEIQTHILHDKMIMKKEKTYSRAPLPFVGQKRMFVSEFKKILKHHTLPNVKGRMRWSYTMTMTTTASVWKTLTGPIPC